MDKNYTQEPWRVEYKHTGVYIFSNDPNLLILSMSHTQSTQKCVDNATRIVSCVNAMNGIENPLEFMESAKKINWKIIDDLKSDRDQLLSLCEEIVSELNSKVESLNIDHQKLDKMIEDGNEPIYFRIKRMVEKVKSKQ